MNLMSLVHARGWAALFNGFGGKDSPKSSAADWLPFPIEDSEALTKDRRKISKATADIYGALYLRGQLPPHVQGAFMSLLDEVEELSGLTLP